MKNKTLKTIDLSDNRFNVLSQRKLTTAAARSARGDGMPLCSVDFSHRSEGNGLGDVSVASSRNAESLGLSHVGGASSGLRLKLGPPNLMIVGGFDGSALQQCEVYDSAQRSFHDVSPLCGPRCSAAVCALNDSRVLVAGGTDGNHLLSSMELYDPERQAWRQLPLVMSAPRRGLQGVFCPRSSCKNEQLQGSQIVLLIGGETEVGETLSSCSKTMGLVLTVMAGFVFSFSMHCHHIPIAQIWPDGAGTVEVLTVREMDEGMDENSEVSSAHAVFCLATLRPSALLDTMRLHIAARFVCYVWVGVAKEVSS